MCIISHFSYIWNVFIPVIFSWLQQLLDISWFLQSFAAVEKSLPKVLQLSLMQMSGPGVVSIKIQWQQWLFFIIVIYGKMSLASHLESPTVNQSSFHLWPLQTLGWGTLGFGAESRVRVKALRPCDPGWEPEEQSWGHCWPRHPGSCVSTGAGSRDLLSSQVGGSCFSFVFLVQIETFSDWDAWENPSHRKSVTTPRDVWFILLKGSKNVSSVFALSSPWFRRLPMCRISGQHCLLSRL